MVYNVVSNEENVSVTDKSKAPSSGGALSMLKTALSGVSGLFVDTVEVPEHPGAATTPQQVPQRPPPMGMPGGRLTPLPAPPGSPHAAMTMPAPTPTVTPDPEAMRDLEERLHKAMTPEYTAFMEHFNMLAPELPEERARFRVALRTSHTTAEQLIAAMDQMAESMKSAHKKFLDGFEAERSKTLAEYEKNVTTADQTIASYEEQMRALEQTMSTIRAKRDADAEAMRVEAERFDQGRLGFEAAVQEITGHVYTQRRSIEAMTASAGKV